MSFPAAPTNGDIHITTDGREYVFNSTITAWEFAFYFSNIVAQNNLTATTVPTVTDDAAAGYTLGSVWIDAATNLAYRLVDSTAGAAVWRPQNNSVLASAPTTPLAGQIYYNSTDGITYVYIGSAWVDITSASGSGIQDNMAAIIAPSVTDDSGAGYSVGSRWVNVTADTAYFCTSSTAGAAVWKQIGAVIFNPLAVDPITPSAGDTWYNTTTSLFKGFAGVAVVAFTVV